MKFRYARHTTDLNLIESFYINIIGLEKLGSFQNHDRYDGTFLGIPGENWHLEFTISDQIPERNFDEDDVLVFYYDSLIELAQMKKSLVNRGIQLKEPLNPYWQKNGIMISDPDGHHIIFSSQQVKLDAKDDLTSLVREHNIYDWNELSEFIRDLPYGRNENREDFSLVLKEGKGSCSSKHAFLKKVADQNNIKVKLILGIYKMNQNNTPGIGDAMAKHQIDFIPEAHCYLKINQHRIDITSPASDFDHISKDILMEYEIEAEQVANYKVQLHKEYLKNWLSENNLSFTFDEIWKIRETCIENLSG